MFFPRLRYHLDLDSSSVHPTKNFHLIYHVDICFIVLMGLPLCASKRPKIGVTLLFIIQSSETQQNSQINFKESKYLKFRDFHNKLNFETYGISSRFQSNYNLSHHRCTSSYYEMQIQPVGACVNHFEGKRQCTTWRKIPIKLNYYLVISVTLNYCQFFHRPLPAHG